MTLVLGVDPGSRVTGYGLVKREDERALCVDCGHINPPEKLPFFHRIHHIFEALVEIINRHQPQEMAIEDIFYAKNAKSSLKLGHARGAVLIAAARCGMGVFEYPPLEIKKAVAGYGRASKEQVRDMVQHMLALRRQPTLDTSDALAVAICHLNQRRWLSVVDRCRKR